MEEITKHAKHYVNNRSNIAENNIEYKSINAKKNGKYNSNSTKTYTNNDGNYIEN